MGTLPSSFRSQAAHGTVLYAHCRGLVSLMLGWQVSMPSLGPSVRPVFTRSILPSRPSQHQHAIRILATRDVLTRQTMDEVVRRRCLLQLLAQRFTRNRLRRCCHCTIEGLPVLVHEHPVNTSFPLQVCFVL
jgi:hypothetical protein